MLPHWLFIVKLFYEKSCVFHFLGYGYDGNKFITCHFNLCFHIIYNIVLSNKDIIPLIHSWRKYYNITVILQLLCSIVTARCRIISSFTLCEFSFSFYHINQSCWTIFYFVYIFGIDSMNTLFYFSLFRSIRFSFRS